MRFAFPPLSPLVGATFVLLLVSGCASSLAQEITVCAELGRATNERPQVLGGEDGWLFNAGDLRSDFPFEPTLPFLERLARGLDRQGTRLVVLLVPTRGMVHADRLPATLPEELASFSAAEARDRYRTLRAALEDRGIIAPDLVDAALALADDEEAFFFRRDHHWTPTGARAAAQATAAAILAQGEPYPSLTKTEFTTTLTGTTHNGGSYRRIVNEVCDTGIPDEPLDQFRTTLAQAGAADLFGDLPTDVVLVGTSFSQRINPQRDFNFAGFLSEALSLNVANEAVGAAGPFGAIEAFLLTEDRTVPSYLVWEIPLGPFSSDNVPSVDGFRQLLPTLAGPCGEEDALAAGSATLAPGGDLRFDLRSELPPEGGYLQFEFEDPRALRFTVVIDFGRGAKRYRIDRSRRVPNGKRFFLDLIDRGGDALNALTLTDLPLRAEGGVRVRICRSQ